MVNNIVIRPLILCLVCLGIYWDAATSMVSVWMSSETYKHCFLIIPIVIYLFWERKQDLARLSYTPNFYILPVLFFIQVVAFIGDSLGVNLIGHVALYSSIVSILWLCLGNAFVKAFIFPLFFLGFSVPFGEELVPVLQDVTAFLTVELLRLFGIPIYREGLYLYVPNGTFLVAEACAGIRFLIASFALGTLYAYMNYQTKWKVAAFIVASLIVPIIANGLRAFGIVVVGYMTDMEHATGADHLVYGWFFFAFVLLILFWLGHFGAEKVAWNRLSETASLHVKSLSNVATASVLMILVAIPAYAYITIGSQNSDLELTLPGDLHEHFDAKERELAWQPFINNPHEKWSGTLNQIPAHIAKFHYDNNEYELVNGLSRTYDIDNWTKKSSGTMATRLGVINTTQLVNVKGDNITLFWWFEVDGERTRGGLRTKIKQMISKIKGKQGKGSFIALEGTEWEFVLPVADQLNQYQR